jgi:hypothetical protein
MDFIQCSIYIKIETEDPTAELLNYISANLNEINDYFVLNFIPIFNKNLKDDSFISKLQDEGVTGLPCMVTYINDKKLDIKEGNRDIINYLMQNSNQYNKQSGFYVENGKIKSSGHITNEDEMRTAMTDLIYNQGDDKEGEEASSHDMEKVKHLAASQGLTDSRFESVVARAKVGRVPFSELNKKRKEKNESLTNDSRRGDRVTAGRGIRKKEINKTNNNQINTSSIAYRGSSNIRSTPMGKVEKKSSMSSLVNDNSNDIENMIKEEAENDYDNYINLPDKKKKMTGSMLKAKMKSNMSVSA